MSTLAETWLEQGTAKGLEQGLEQGKLAHARWILRQQLGQLFGELPHNIDTRIEQADQATILSTEAVDKIVAGRPLSIQ